MSIPLPPTDLEGHCSAIYNNDLYVLSSTALQSLSIEEHAQWKQQNMGQSVTDPACVTAIPEGDTSDAAMWVIGGQSSDSGFSGLQRFFFRNQTWETLSPQADVLMGRFNHSATYLNDSQSILVYAGSQSNDPSTYSSQTFLVSTVPPFNILSFNSKAPPGNLPILQPWNSSHAVMVGGSPTNTDVWLFGPQSGWSKFPTSLSQPLQRSTRAALVGLDNDAKVLEIYNISASPNTVENVVLLDGHGRPAENGQTVGSGKTTRKRSRELTLANWPAYNNSNAPTTVRSDCSIAQSSDGLVAIAGGNNDAPLALFNRAENSWVDAGQFFNDPSQQPLQPSTTPASTPSGSSTPSSDGTHNRTTKTLGITLGVLFGIAAILIIALLLLRRRKLRQRKVTEQQVVRDDENRMSFADRGASFMKEAGVSLSDLLPPTSNRFNPSRASNSSLAIITGKFGNRRSTNGHVPAASFDSTAQLVGDRPQHLSTGDHIEMMDIGEKAPMNTLRVPSISTDGKPLESEAKARRKRSSGWSKYFATSQPNRLSHLPSAYAKSHSVILDGESTIPENPLQSHASRTPSLALVPPIDTDIAKVVDGQRVSHVPSASPSYSNSREDLVLRGGSMDVIEGQKGTIVDPSGNRRSRNNSVSSNGNRSTLSSNVPSEFLTETGHTPWTPMNNSNRDAEARRTSSVYTASVDYSNRIPSRGKSGGFFPGSGSAFRPSTKPTMGYAAGPTSEWAAPPNIPFSERVGDRDSNVTVFPSGLADQDEPISHTQQSLQPQQASGVRKTPSNDMSWLNLGLNR